MNKITRETSPSLHEKLCEIVFDDLDGKVVNSEPLKHGVNLTSEVVSYMDNYYQVDYSESYEWGLVNDKEDLVFYRVKPVEKTVTNWVEI
jgi:hypothetical protein